jgi:hypothetical protein
MCQAQQKWTIEPVANAGGYLGSPYFKIIIAGTDRTLAATEGAELVVLPNFTGGPEQLWRFDQLADGSWRIRPKAIPNSPNSKDPLVLSAVGCNRPGIFTHMRFTKHFMFVAAIMVSALLALAIASGIAAQIPAATLTTPATPEKATNADPQSVHGHTA